MKSLSRVQLLVTPWSAAYQAPLSMGFSRQEHWSGVPLPSPSFPFYCFPLFPCLITKEDFFPLLAIFWNSAFKWAHLSFSPLPLPSLLFSAVCKASSYNHFDLLHLFFLGMVLITAYCTVLRISIHSSSGTLSIRSNPLNIFVTFTV